ncbi:GDNF-inducible zinc finger protein 1-like [Anopheles darlingi]|uniref:GDNF-inducible zinc finger protein 1-like n=1 Tax=Anopheles darlingi TaxID=43151 RepID=UPI002100161C|nr:GDNF-inducible zinc finger protein 1-like [Anopheles darlingi]
MLTKYCRICLTSASVVNQLDEVVHKSLTLYAMLCKLYPEAFSGCENHQWPTRVCGNCKHGILEAYRLYAVCMSTFSVLKNQLPNSLIKPCQLTFQSDRPVTSNSFSGQDGIDFKNTVIIIDDEEDDKRSPMDEQEVKFYTQNEKTDDEEHDSCETFLMGEQAIAHESIKNTSLALEPLNAEIFKVDSAAATCKTANTVGQPINMATSIDEEQEEDSRESMDFLDDVEDSLHGTYNDDNQAEKMMNEKAVTEQAASDSIVKSKSFKDDCDESEGEDIFAEMFSSEIFSCKSCRVVFVDKESHVTHVKNHKKGYTKFCKMCNEGFKTVSDLCAHECYSNSSTLCWICGKTMDASSNYKAHMKSHTYPKTIKATMWDCQLCPLRFSTEYHLKAHLVTHKKQQLYCCDVCGVKVTTKRYFLKHQWTRHKATKEELYTFSCEICSQRFSSIYILKRHMNTHTGLRPYSCVYCNRVYGSGGDLVEHVAKHHVGNDNIYQCHLCDADFPKIKKLKDHYEVHYRNGEKLDNEILTEFGRFRFTIMDLLKMRRRKETTALSNDNANN